MHFYSSAGLVMTRKQRAFAYTSLANKGNSVCVCARVLVKGEGEMGQKRRFMRPLEDPLHSSQSRFKDGRRDE